MTESRDPAVHFVRGGRYPHVVVRDGGASVRQTQVLTDVTCAVCLGALAEFLGVEPHEHEMGVPCFEGCPGYSTPTPFAIPRPYAERTTP